MLLLRKNLGVASEDQEEINLYKYQKYTNLKQDLKQGWYSY